MQFGLTPEQPCHYLPGQEERLLVALPDDNETLTPEAYQSLMQQGFRRSHNHTYRPHCALCSACESLRVLVPDFQLTKNQKRLIRKNRDLTLRVRHEPTTEYSQLFCDFIEQRHADGEMYPPEPEQFWHWVSCDWLTPELFEWRDSHGNLLIVSVVDRTPDAMSAVYTFFHPQHDKRSPGTYAVLEMIRVANERQLSHLYLGYQIDDCKKMNYKTRFAPYERRIGNQWQKALKSQSL